MATRSIWKRAIQVLTRIDEEPCSLNADTIYAKTLLDIGRKIYARSSQSWQLVISCTLLLFPPMIGCRLLSFSNGNTNMQIMLIRHGVGGFDRQSFLAK